MGLLEINIKYLSLNYLRQRHLRIHRIHDLKILLESR